MEDTRLILHILLFFNSFCICFHVFSLSFLKPCTLLVLHKGSVVAQITFCQSCSTNLSLIYEKYFLLKLHFCVPEFLDRDNLVSSN